MEGRNIFFDGVASASLDKMYEGLKIAIDDEEDITRYDLVQFIACYWGQNITTDIIKVIDRLYEEEIIIE